MSTPRRSNRVQALRSASQTDEWASSQVKTEPVKKRKLEGRHEGLSEYEIRRLENIAHNKRVLATLGLESARQELKVAAAKPKRIPVVRTMGVKRDTKPKAPPPPKRRSLRVQGKDADGKELPLHFKEPTVKGGYGGQFSSTAQGDDAELSIQGNVELEEDGQVFLQSLVQTMKTEGGSRPAHSSGVVEDGSFNEHSLRYAQRMASLTVDAEEGVRKITKERIYSLAMSPVPGKVIVAAGDKFGGFGLWAVGSSLGEDGVLSLRPHSSTLADIKFNHIDPNKIYTSSYDGRVMLFDITKGKSGFTELSNNGRESELYEMELDKSGGSMYIARGDGVLNQFDLRSGKMVNDWQLHEKKINTVNICHGNENYITTASLDRSVGVFDIRQMKKALHSLPHALSLNQSTWSPDGKVLLTLCQDNVIRCYDAPHLIGNPQKPTHFPAKPKHTARHDNRTGRWLTKFKVCWDPKQADAFVIGSMDQPRCIEVFNSSCARLMRLRVDDVVKSVQSLCVFHPTKDVIVSANASGKVYLWGTHA